MSATRPATEFFDRDHRQSRTPLAHSGKSVFELVAGQCGHAGKDTPAGGPPERRRRQASQSEAVERARGWGTGMSTGKSSRQNDSERFSNFKQRGEWVELQFMAQAARRRFAISKPWGETQAYDVGIQYAPNFLRVQVKSTTYRMGAGYLCQFKPNHKKKRDYSLEEIDLFAAYVIERMCGI